MSEMTELPGALYKAPPRCAAARATTDEADVASGEESRLTQFGFEPSDEAVQPRALGGAKNNKGNLTFLEVSRQNQKKLSHSSSACCRVRAPRAGPACRFWRGTSESVGRGIGVYA